MEENKIDDHLMWLDMKAAEESVSTFNCHLNVNYWKNFLILNKNFKQALNMLEKIIV